MQPLVIIPARGGSKGVPNKNIKLLNGIPLIHYAIKEARSIFRDSQIIISTDSIKIKEVVEETGLAVPFLRPSTLATDGASSEDVIQHALNYMLNDGFNPDVIILLQPTSPLRTKEHIKEALELYTTELDMLVSVKLTDANPYYLLKEENEDGYLVASKKGEFTRRQDCPPVYELNGAIYIINVKSLKTKKISEFTKTKKYVMDTLSSLDIDDSIDWQLAEILIKDQNY